MAINIEVLKNLLYGVTFNDNITVDSREDIKKFIETGDFNSFSDKARKELVPIWKITLNPAYFAITKEFLPNIFAKEE